MVRFIRQGEKRRGERRKFRTKEQLCGEQRLARGTAEQWYGGNGSADMCRGGEMARGAAELPGEGVMAKRANDERMRRQDGYEL